MTTNITQGNTARFVVEFLDPTTGVLSVPSSASITIVYTATSGSTASTTLTMTLTGSTYTTTWGTSVAKFGLAEWETSAPGQASTTGTLRLLG